MGNYYLIMGIGQFVTRFLLPQDIMSKMMCLAWKQDEKTISGSPVKEQPQTLFGNEHIFFLNLFSDRE